MMAVLAFFIMSSVANAAAPPAPELLETDWRTGEIEVCWNGVVPGNTIILYTRTAKQTSFTVHESWIAETSTGCHVSKYYENGQTVWHFIVQQDVNTGELSEPSVVGRQTPPITAFIINWPQMWDEMKDFFTALDQSMKDHLDGLFTPSTQAMNDLNAAVSNLKNALGVGQAQQVGNDLTGGLNAAQNGMRPPMVVDDGNGTYTGGSTGGQLPFPNRTIGELNAPNPDSGTDTELTMRIPYMVDMNGNLIYMKLFTAEQMEKMKWFGLLRDLAAATMFILFAVWLVTRFSPQMKS